MFKAGNTKKIRPKGLLGEGSPEKRAAALAVWVSQSFLDTLGEQ